VGLCVSIGWDLGSLNLSLRAVTLHTTIMLKQSGPCRSFGLNEKGLLHNAE
jgi:hypothetical protein